jgi:hypothetical protein
MTIKKESASTDSARSDPQDPYGCQSLCGPISNHTKQQHDREIINLFVLAKEDGVKDLLEKLLPEVLERFGVSTFHSTSSESGW